MSRVHDMGGKSGGPIVVDEQERPVFKEAWHGRALAVTVAAGALGIWNIDASRHARECLDPEEYLQFSYYEKWIAALANLLVAHGLATTDELEHPEMCPVSESENRALRRENVRNVLMAGSPTGRNLGVEGQLKPGQLVRTREVSCNLHISGGHTRLPAYAQGCIGRVVREHGMHVFPDSNAHFLGDAPEPLYSVAFEAKELWGLVEGNADDEVVLDLWESYLESV